MTVISQGITMSVKEMKKYYDKADEVERAIIQHSATAGGVALIPCPGIEAGMLLIQIRMYKKIHDITGIPIFSKEILWNIGKFILSQVAGLLGALTALFVASVALRWIPGANFIAGFAQAPIIGIGNYICGITYYKMLGEILSNGNFNDIASGSVDLESTIARLNAMSKESLRAAKEKGNEVMKAALMRRFFVI